LKIFLKKGRVKVEDKKEIFCYSCRFLKHNRDCVYKDNFKKATNYWYEKTYISIKTPCEINKNNDCEWFKNKYFKGG
jgi:hypothetical protein